MTHRPPRHYLRLRAALLALALVGWGSTFAPAPVAAASWTYVRTTPWSGSLDLYKAGVYTTQPDYITCVPTSVQIMRNIIAGTSDHSTSEIRAWYSSARSWTYMTYSEPGLDPRAWARLLSTYGAGPYVDRSFSSFDAALSAAAYEMRLTQKPIGLLVMHGGHAWVMNGFSATADPLTTSSFSVTKVRVTGPLYPMQQRNGYDMPPDTELTASQLRTYLTTYTDTNPVPWLGRYVIVAPLLLDHPLASYAPVARLGGADRYAVAAEISATTFPSGAPVAYLATGQDYPDALTGSVAAARTGGPILLVTPTGLPAATATELARLRVSRLVVLGGAGSVPDTIVAAAVSAARTAPSVVRLGGIDRYAVAAAVSAATFPKGAPVAYLATGQDYPDALTGSVAAARAGGPILLVTSTGLPAATAAELVRLRPASLVVLGGAGSVPDAVVTAARAAAGTASVTRLGGADRYAVAAAVAAAAFPKGAPVAYVATGLGFPDALTGSVAAARAGGPLLLVKWSSIPGPIATELGQVAPGRIVILGGLGSVSDSVAGF